MKKTLTNKGAIVTLLQFSKYGIVGLIGTCLHTGVMIICIEIFDINTFLSSSLGFILSLAVSFLLNTLWTFRTQINSRPLIRYSAISIMGQMLNLFILFLFVTILSQNYITGHVVAIIIVPIFNFILNKVWAFRL